MKKVKRIIFEYTDHGSATWTPESFEDKYAANYICEALHIADKFGGVDALLLGIKSKGTSNGAKYDVTNSTGLLGTPKHIMQLIDRALEKVDAALESSGEGEEEEKE